jgi:hypothetical protein
MHAFHPLGHSQVPHQDTAIFPDEKSPAPDSGFVPSSKFSLQVRRALRRCGAAGIDPRLPAVINPWHLRYGMARTWTDQAVSMIRQ